MKRVFVLMLLSVAVSIFAEEKITLLCGTTMRYAVEELTEEFSKKNNVEFEISYGGSGSLKNLIQEKHVGDLFLPGSDSYINQMLDSGEVLDTAYIGDNQAALIVGNGNPRGITTLDDLMNPEFCVVLARSDSGSIGKEASKILSTAGIEESVLNNVLYLTTDSKDIDSAIIDGIADVTINWKATSTWTQNKEYMEAIEIPAASKKKLVFGLLKYSDNSDMASKFIDFASTEYAKSIFDKHGF